MNEFILFTAFGLGEMYINVQQIISTHIREDDAGYDIVVTTTAHHSPILYSNASYPTREMAVIAMREHFGKA
jgi:hypothetical protein